MLLGPTSGVKTCSASSWVWKQCALWDHWNCSTFTDLWAHAVFICLLATKPRIHAFLDQFPVKNHWLTWRAAVVTVATSTGSSIERYGQQLLLHDVQIPEIATQSADAHIACHWAREDHKHSRSNKCSWSIGHIYWCQEACNVNCPQKG